MSVILEADNRVLLNSQRYTYTKDNYSPGVSSIFVTNTEGFSDTTKFLLIGNIGTESAEIFKIGSVNNTTGEITLQNAGGISTTTIYGHPESSRVTVMPYNQIGFFWTSGTTYSDTNPISGFINIQPSEWFSIYEDSSNSTGYGWFVFYNSVQVTASQPSNPIPYVGFEGDTVQSILEDFFSLLSNKELKIIDRADALSWLNEGNAIVRTKMNLSNREYTASEELTLSIVGGTAEYDLPEDFSKLVYLKDSAATYGQTIDLISLRDVPTYMGSTIKYYLRGTKIGIVPTPTAAGSFLYRYLSKTGRLSLNSDTINLPDNGVFIVKDFMLYRANMKLQNINMAMTYKNNFEDGLNKLVASLVDRDGHLDSFDIAAEANT
jgi:hypothetical protein